MLKSAWAKETITLCVVAIVAVATWTMITQMSPETFNMLIGGAIVLVVFIVASLLIIAIIVAQGYVSRRLIKQDDMDDLKQLVTTATIMRGLQPPVNVRMPDQLQAPPFPMGAPSFQVLDATTKAADDVIEME